MTLADKGDRVGNFIVDTIVLLTIIYTLTLIMIIFFPETDDDDSPAASILFSTTYFSYYFFLELLTGKTIGKILTKTIVVDRNGKRPKAARIIIRTLMRMFPIEILSFVFGNFGFHDVISRTTVIKNIKPEVAKSKISDQG